MASRGKPDQPEPEHLALRVLIADDDPDTLAMLGVTFRSLGCEVQLVDRLRDVRRQLSSQPDLVVIDLMMPEHDGVEVIEAMAAEGVESALLIISSVPDRVLAAAQNFAQMSGLRVLGALRKPLWVGQLRELLEPLRGGPETADAVDGEEFSRLLDAGRLTVHYAPVVDARGARLHALEALPRLDHPRLGLLSERATLAAAEALGVVPAVRGRTLAAAIDDAARFRDEGFPVALQVAAPVADLDDGAFAQELLERCRGHRLLPSALALAVVEADLPEHFVAALGTLTRLGMHGVQLLLDDFLLGSPARALLERLPVSTVKLPGAVLDRLLEDADARAQVIDVVAYAQGRNLTVAARHVAAAEQLGLLLDLGVDFFQGPLLTAPRSFAETCYWLRDLARHLAELGIRSHLGH